MLAIPVATFLNRISKYDKWCEELGNTNLLKHIIFNLDKLAHPELLSPCSKLVYRLCRKEENVVKLFNEVDINALLSVLNQQRSSNHLLASSVICSLYLSPVFRTKLHEIKNTKALAVNHHIKELQKDLLKSPKSPFIRNLEDMQELSLNFPELGLPKDIRNTNTEDYVKILKKILPRGEENNNPWIKSHLLFPNHGPAAVECLFAFSYITIGLLLKQAYFLVCGWVPGCHVTGCMK
eukprot:TRINITY_DN602_c0_g1_i8.p1 TRINITY_DN602_c0_g1~~TRINITY_DN602_c0_g1_i8.p1  ORF type:complete len:237 (-),score=36.66 TRINITY_DN602_c0_g1_i8:663-1373(-)